MGQEDNLLSEFNEEDIINGGYQEFAGKHWAERWGKALSEDWERAENAEVATRSGSSN